MLDLDCLPLATIGKGLMLKLHFCQPMKWLDLSLHDYRRHSIKAEIILNTSLM